jgi:hypothetical protein
MNVIRTGDRPRLYQDLVWKLMEGAAGRVAQAALTPDVAAHGWFDELVQAFRRLGMEVILALRRFQGEEGFKKIVFLYERSRYLYENKEGNVQNEAKTKLKTSWFLTQMTRKNPRTGWFLTKRTQKNLALRLGVRRLDAAFAPCGGNAVLNRAGAVPKFQGGVEPPHSKVISAQAFSEQLPQRPRRQGRLEGERVSFIMTKRSSTAAATCCAGCNEGLAGRLQGPKSNRTVKCG